jgi:putative DNA primase/helicase
MSAKDDLIARLEESRRRSIERKAEIAAQAAAQGTYEPPQPDESAAASAGNGAADAQRRTNGNGADIKRHVGFTITTEPDADPDGLDPEPAPEFVDDELRGAQEDDSPEPGPEPEPEPTGQAGEDGLLNPEDGEGEGEPAETPEPVQVEEPVGNIPTEPVEAEPTDPVRAEIARLAALDELDFEKVRKAKAAELGMDGVGVLERVVKAARRAARARAKTIEAEAKAKATVAKQAAAEKATAADKAVREAEKAAKEAKRAAEKAAADAAREAKDAAREAKAEEQARKAKERQERLKDQKKQPRPPLTDDDEDPLHRWTPPDPATLAEIIVAGGERPAIADAALAAMAKAVVPFYTRGGDLVRVCLLKLKQSNGKTVRIPAIKAITKPMMLRAMGLCATWWTYTKELERAQIDPPGDLADHILGMIGEWPFPPLRGVISCPTMRYDGTLLTKPGYDLATGLVLFNPPKMPTIPPNPDKWDALEALDVLKDLLEEVRFAKDNNVSMTGALSLMMTPVLRAMMPVAPLHIVNKPAPGTGGSYMQDIMSAIATGERCPVIALTTHNDEENEKRLSSAAYSGQPVIAIDNFIGDLMGQFLCQMVERPTPQIRLLGKTELVTIMNGYCVVANGNNVSVVIDMVRRILQIDLDADEENPETRTFKRNPVAEILADRGRYIAAILTIASAYRRAGSPGKLAPRLSFEEWSDTVRSALVWLGLPDCDLSIQTVRAADPRDGQLHAIFAAWDAELQVGIGYTTGELVKLAGEFPGNGSDRTRPMLWDAFMAVAADKAGKLDPGRLGHWLRDHKNRISGKLKLISDNNDKQRPRWKLDDLKVTKTEQ